MITVQCTAKSCENQCIQTDFVWGFLSAGEPGKIIVFVYQDKAEEQKWP